MACVELSLLFLELLVELSLLLLELLLQIDVVLLQLEVLLELEVDTRGIVGLRAHGAGTLVLGIIVVGKELLAVIARRPVDALIVLKAILNVGVESVEIQTILGLAIALELI